MSALDALAVIVVGIMMGVVCVVFITVVHEGEAAVVMRLGKFRRVCWPGLAVVIPGFEQVVTISTKPVLIIGSFACFTADGVRVTGRTTMLFDVARPELVMRNLQVLQVSCSADAEQALTDAISSASVEELITKPTALVWSAAEALTGMVGRYGLAFVSLSALKLRCSETVETALGPTLIAAAARAQAMATVDVVARRLDERTIELERIEALRATARAGGVRTWLPPASSASRE